MKMPKEKIHIDDALWDLKRFPLPIVFNDPYGEVRALNRRDEKVKTVIARFNKMVNQTT